MARSSPGASRMTENRSRRMKGCLEFVDLPRLVKKPGVRPRVFVTGGNISGGHSQRGTKPIPRKPCEFNTCEQEKAPGIPLNPGRPGALFSYLEGDLQAFVDQEFDQINHAAGIAPLVVVPGDDFEKVTVQHLGHQAINDGAVRI